MHRRKKHDEEAAEHGAYSKSLASSTALTTYQEYGEEIHLFLLR